MTSLLKLPITRDIAQACALDEGNRSMRQAGRRAWDVEDYNAAVACFNRLWPQEEMEEI